MHSWNRENWIVTRKLNTKTEGNIKMQLTNLVKLVAALIIQHKIRKLFYQHLPGMLSPCKSSFAYKRSSISKRDASDRLGK